MLFCPKCGALMRPTLEKGKKVLGCACGYTKRTEGSHVREVVERTPASHDIVNEGSTVLPLTEAHCPKCKHDRAHWWSKQMRASDEPETKFLRCEKCKHTWRDSN